MADWNDRFPDRPSGGEPNRKFSENDRGRDDFERDEWDRSSRWGSGDYRQNESWRDRDSYSGRRGEGYMGGDWGRSEWNGRASGGGYAGYDNSRAPQGSGYGRTDYERDAEFGGNYARSAGSNMYRSDYTSGETGRTRGMSGNYLGGGGGYGTARDYENAPGHGYGIGRDLEYTRPSFRGRGPKGYQRSDERIREMACERLHDDHDIDASEIEVSVSNGEVTLSGTVDDRHTKMLAEELVESIGGVKDVHNSLKVDRSFFSRMAEKVREAVSDTGDKR